jgi:hypothetical protein
MGEAGLGGPRAWHERRWPPRPTAPAGGTDDKVRCGGRCQLPRVEEDSPDKVEGAATHRNGGGNDGGGKEGGTPVGGGGDGVAL